MILKVRDEQDFNLTMKQNIDCEKGFIELLQGQRRCLLTAVFRLHERAGSEGNSGGSKMITMENTRELIDFEYH